MAKLSETQFKKEVSSGNYKTLYLIYGEEKYLVKYYTELLMNKAAGKEPSDFDLIQLNADSSLEEIYAAASQLSLFSKYKCVCVKDYDMNTLSEDEFQELLKFCSELEFGTVLIFTMPTYSNIQKKKTAGKSKNNKFEKFVDFAEKYGTTLQLEKMTSKKLEDQLISWAEKNGCQLSKVNASKIVERVGMDLTALRNELAKLCAYAGNQEITYDMIELLCVKNSEVRIFALSDHIAKNRFSEAYQQLDILFEQNERPENILAILSSVYADMYRVKIALESGKNTSDVAKDFKYGSRAFVLDKAAVNAKKYSSDTLRKILDIILETDIKLKSTRENPRFLLETLLSRLIIIVQGEY